MVCNECGDKPKKTCGAFPRSVIEIDNPETLVLLRKVVIPASLGDEDDVPPAIGKYHNVILQYEVNKHIYIYSSDGIPTAIEAANIPSDIVERIEALEGEMITETSNREAADSELDTRLTSAEEDISTLQAADTTLRNAISDEVVARQNADSALSGRIDAEATARQAADTALENSLSSEATTRANADTALNTQISGVSNDLASETAARQTADTNLQSQIDAVVASSDVRDIVGTKAELNNYDTSTLGNNDIIKVLDDETQNDAVTYYRWNASTQQFTLIGSEGPYYTKASTDTLLNAKADKATTYTKTETDNLLSGKQGTLTAGNNIQISGNTISATDTTYTAGTGLNLSNGEFSVDTTTIAEKSDIPSVVQTTGTSTTDVMSQKATTNMIFPEGSESTHSNVLIGSLSSTPANLGTYNIRIGSGVSTANNEQETVVIGHGAGSSTSAGNSVSIGHSASAKSESVAIGHSASASASSNTVAIGHSAQAFATDAIAIGSNIRVNNAGSVVIGNGHQNNTQYTTRANEFCVHASATANQPMVHSNVDTPTLGTDAANKNYVDKAKPHYEGYLQEYTTTANTGTVNLHEIIVSEDGVYLVTLSGWVNENGVAHAGSIYPYVQIADATTVYANTQTIISDATTNMNEQQTLSAMTLVSLSANDKVYLQFGQSNTAAAGMKYKYSYGVIKLSN